MDALRGKHGSKTTGRRALGSLDGGSLRLLLAFVVGCGIVGCGSPRLPQDDRAPSRAEAPVDQEPAWLPAENREAPALLHSPLQALYDATGNEESFDIEPPRRAEGLVLEAGLVRVELSDGQVVPLSISRDASDSWSALHRVVGVVWEGHGALRVQVPAPGDRQALVVDLAAMGVPVSHLGGLTEGESLLVPVDRLLLLSADSALLERTLEGQVLIPVEERPVSGVLPAMISRVALDAYGPEGARWLPALLRRTREDAFLQDAIDEPVRFARVHTALRVQLPAQPEPVEGWLFHLRDPVLVDAPWPEGVFWSWSPGQGRLKALAIRERGISAGLRLARVEAEVEAAPLDRQQALSVSVRGELTLEAVGRSVRSFRLEPPTDGIVPGSLEIEAIEIEGGASVAVQGAAEVSLARQPAEILCVLPRALAPGQVALVHYRLRVKLPFDVVAEDGGQQLALGPATRTWDPFMRLHGDLGGNAHGYRLAVGVPQGGAIEALLTGQGVRYWDADGLRWLESESPKPRYQLGVAFGRWSSWSSPPGAAPPALEIRRFPEAGEPSALAPWLHRLVAAEERLLGPYPWSSLAFYDGPFAVDETFWHAGYGLIGASHIMATPGWITQLEARMPGWPDSFIAHELAHAWWGHALRPAAAEDTWLRESMAVAVSCLALDEAYPGQGRCAEMQQAWRRMVELPGNPRALSLTRAVGSADWYERVYLYGPLVLLGVLRGRIGVAAFDDGLRLVVERHGGGTVTTSQLRAAFEASSGMDLEDLFQFWIEVGRVPVLGGRYHLVEVEPGVVMVEGELHVDVVAGTLDVPVQVEADGQTMDSWVSVHDGQGRFSIGPVSGGAVQVRLDPERRVIARGREIVREPQAQQAR